MAGKKKQVKQSKKVNSRKQAKQSPEIDPNAFYKQKVSWRISNLDMGGPFGWQNIDKDTFLHIQEQLSNFETMTWNDIFIKGSYQNHPSLVKEFSKEAKRRLQELELDDYDELHRIRLSNKERIWGIFEEGFFRILWWDPNHEVYPVEKKHT